MRIIMDNATLPYTMHYVTVNYACSVEDEVQDWKMVMSKIELK